MTSRRSKHRSDRGVALIEAAIVLPFLVLLVVGMIEAGFAFRDGNTLARATQQAARSSARLATNPVADYEALRALNTGLSSVTASSIERVIIYDAGDTGDRPPTSCLSLPRPDNTATVGLGGGVRCNVYSRTQVRSDQPAMFGCSGGWDSNFCPASRTRTGDTPTKVGVWVELSYDKVTSVLPGSMSLTRASVYQLEPCIAGDSTC